MRNDFRVFAPLTFFEKASAPEGEKMRIAGIVSTEVQDKQGETVLQRGLDFGPFVKSGWFNDNHSKVSTGILGYPDRDVIKFQKGQRLPDGTVAEHCGTWAEGHLLDTADARKVWDIGRALQKAGGARRLGFSIEGKVQKREGPAGTIVAKAVVSNVALTHVPVGEGTRMNALAKSLTAIEAGEDMDKALTMGDAPAGNPSTQGAKTGEGAGKILAVQHLEDDEDETAEQEQAEHGRVQTKEEEEAEKKKPLTKSVAVATIQNRMGCGRETAERAYGLFLNLKQQWLLGANR